MKRRERGQSMVELALMLPFFVLITLGVMELGVYVYSYSELENATRRASEMASVSPPWTVQTCDDVLPPATRPGGCSSQAAEASTRDECAALIKQAALDGVWLSRLQASHITITYPFGETRMRGNRVQVAVDYTGEWLSPIGRRFFGNAMRFTFTSRRTITDTAPPDGRNIGCTL